MIDSGENQETPIFNKNKLPLREEFSCLILVGVAIYICSRAISHTLPPLIMFWLGGLHFIVLSLTRFNESDPHPILHFTRPIEGPIVAGTPLVMMTYFITILIEGSDPKAIERAEICAVFFYFMLVVVIMAGITIIGIYFAIRAFWYWSWFLSAYPGYNPPFIIYPGVFIIFLMGLGVWYTLIRFLTGALSKNEYYGEKTAEYQKIARLTLFSTFLISFFLLIIEVPLIQTIIETIVS
jgi:hypothetical protein